MVLFNGIRVEEAFQNNNSNIVSEIARIPDNTLVDTDIEKLAESLYQKYHIRNDINLKVKELKTNIDMRPIRTGGYTPGRGTYQVAVVNYIIPIDGNSNILTYTPRNFYGSGIEAELSNYQISIDLYTHYGTIDLPIDLQKSVMEILRTKVEAINKNIENVIKDINGYNSTLKSTISQHLLEIQTKLINKRKVESGLNPFA